MEINVSYIYISERLLKTRQWIVFQTADSSSRTRWPELIPAAQGTRQAPIPDRTPFRHRATHRRPHWLRLGSCRHSSSPGMQCTASGCGRKPEYLEQTHADTGRMCKLHTDSGSSWELIFLFFHQCYNQMTLNETTLFEDMLYREFSRSTDTNYVRFTFLSTSLYLSLCLLGLQCPAFAYWHTYYLMLTNFISF